MRSIWILPGLVLIGGWWGLAGSPRAVSGSEWLPGEPLFPRTLADPREPRTGLVYSPDPDAIDASVGGPLPIVGGDIETVRVMAVLEAGVLLRLGREGSFFPLETTDGFFGLGLEGSTGSFRSRLRLMHQSAHTADGDSTVGYPGRTFSREYWSIDVGYVWKHIFVYGRLGSSWHAVPEDPGMDVGIGGTWKGSGKVNRPRFAVYLEADAEREWRVNQSWVAGWETGRDRLFRLLLRYQNGNRPHGQYWTTPERFLGIEIQFST